ncbi:hypothetical protein GGF31_000191 [Allomyces arbusculus]|nr:hypothetical protein GGF31_000191 [Allomyces arbusculus]
MTAAAPSPSAALAPASPPGLHATGGPRRTAHVVYQVATRPSRWQQLVALCTKSMKLRWRDPVPWIMSWLVPCYMLAILIALTLATTTKQRSPTTNSFPRLTVDAPCTVDTGNPAGCVHLAYTNSTPIDAIATQLTSLIRASEPSAPIIRHYPSRDAIFDAFRANPASIVAAVQFDADAAAATGPAAFRPYSDPNNVTFPLTSNAPTMPVVSYTILTNYSSLPSGLVGSRYLTTQIYVERAIINARRLQFALPPLGAPFRPNANGDATNDEVSYVNTLEPRATTMASMFAFYFCFMLQPIWRNVMLAVASEKKAKIKATMTVMGLDPTTYQLATFLTHVISDLPTMLLVALISALANLFSLTDTSVLVVTLVLFLFCAIAMGLTAVVFLSDPKQAETVSQLMMIAALLFYGLGLLFVFDGPFSERTGIYHVAEPFLYLLVPPINLARIINLFAQRETALLHTTWSTLAGTEIPKLIGFMVGSALLYLAFAWYFDKVFPGELGQPWPWTFPLQRAYWAPDPDVPSEDALKSTPSILANVPHRVPLPVDDMIDDDHPEENERPEQLAIIADDVVKKFPYTSNGVNATKLAVNHLSLNVRRGEVLAFLGHNGCGKTTFISTVTGLFKSDGGRIAVLGTPLNGASLRRIQRQIGLCPQYDLLWPTLTSMEHLQVFAAIKGVQVVSRDGAPCTDLDAYLMHLLHDVYLGARAHDRVAPLSGGMKRKLSVAMALLGAPALTILDEPTTGMDVYTRQQVWQLIHDARKHSTVLLTSHSLEEADALADRIAVISKGQLRALGTSLFLKKRFGAGYRLTVEKDERALASGAFDAHRVLAVLDQWFPGVTLDSESFTSATFTVPDMADDDLDARFTAFFGKWDEINETHELRCAAIGLGMVTLEDIFLALNDQWAAQEKEKGEDPQIVFQDAGKPKARGPISWLVLKAMGKI